MGIPGKLNFNANQNSWYMALSRNFRLSPVPFSALSGMGRGKNWDAEENCVLSRAWIAASEDPIAGTDQARKLFPDTIRRRFT